MSDAIYPTRLRWDGKHGCARHDGVHIELRERPAGMIWIEVDYAPGVVSECRDRDCDPRRDLHADEVKMIRGWLACMADRARRG